MKVTDFGLALTRSAEGADQRLTNAGVVLGTPVYMAPEQFARSDIDHRADIYSLGATVYHALTGQAPFDGVNVWDVMVKKTESVPRPGEPVSAESADLVAAMMAVKPAERIGSYTELIARIDELPCMRSEPATGVRPRRSPHRHGTDRGWRRPANTPSQGAACQPADW